MQWLMLQQDKPEDFVIATGVQHSVRQFVQFAASELGITVAFEGKGQGEVGRVVDVTGDRAKVRPGDVIVRVDARYFRPTEVEALVGDAGKAHRMLGWKPKITLAELVREMVQADYLSAKRDALVKSAGYQAFDYHE
jgi:GDPmannose 4,6-dehydratase